MDAKRLPSSTVYTLAVFILGLCLAAGVGRWRQLAIEENAEAQFKQSEERVAADVSRRFRQPIYGLNGAKGVYASSKSVERGEFAAYVESRNLPIEFPGVRGFGFIQKVIRPQLDAFVSAERADGAPKFAIHQLADTHLEDLYVIKFIEPAAQNASALGLDIGSESSRRAAAQLAVDTGEPAISSMITLVQDNHKQPAVLIFVPVYIKGARPSTPEERRASLLGLLYAPVVIADLLAQMPDVGPGRMDFELFDNAQGTADRSLLYDADNHIAGQSSDQEIVAGRRFSRTHRLALPGRELILRVSSTPGFDATIDRASPWVVFILGSLLSALFALLVRQQATGRQRAELLAEQMTEQLRYDETRSRDFSMSASDWFWETDAEHRFCYFSENFDTVFGLAPQQLLGKNRKELLALDQMNPPDLIKAHLAQLEARLPFKNFEYQIRSNGNEIIWLMASGVPHFNADKTFAGYRGTGAIVTDRKKIELQLEEQNWHLEEVVEKRTADLAQALNAAQLADQTKDAFLANMSHELRTPLNAVIGMANMARGLSADPRQLDYLDKIVTSGKHLNRIINDLLDLSKIAAGHMEIENISFSLRTTVQHCVELMAVRAADKNLTLVDSIDAAVPDVLLGDPLRVEQILLNLVGNAIKFSSAGRVEIRVSLHAHENNRSCLDIDVEDFGIGIRPEDLERLFKPFSQADATVSRKFGGTGLGLSISKKLSQMMGGDISVKSREGCGTTFKLRIWFGVGDAANLPSTVPPIEILLPERYLNARILVADDQPLNREIVEALLVAVGIVPCMVENGQEAVEALNENGPDAFDLVLMDIQMPVMDGIAATRMVRSHAGFESLPIIAMTAHTMTHEKAVSSAAGMNDHIGKPFDNVSFYRTLAKWIPESKRGVARGAEPIAIIQPTLNEAVNDLSTLSGIDIRNGLARFNGKEERYHHWLKDFAATAGAVPAQIRSDIAVGNLATAAKTAHAFKGRVGMLGMGEIHRQVSVLEQTLARGDVADIELSTLESLIFEIRDQLTIFFGTADTLCEKNDYEKVLWSEAYSVGVREMDEQHKKLLAMINQLADCLSGQIAQTSEVFHEILSAMFDYTQVHFKTEEGYLQKIGYPLLAAHKMEHAVFVDKVTALSFVATDGVCDCVGIYKYLKAWLLSHILESDMQYSHFVEENNGRS